MAIGAGWRRPICRDYGDERGGGARQPRTARTARMAPCGTVRHGVARGTLGLPGKFRRLGAVYRGNDNSYLVLGAVVPHDNKLLWSGESQFIQ